MDGSPVPSAADETSLSSLRDSVMAVLGKQCTRALVHAHIDGKHDLDAELWGHASALGWLAIGVPEEYGGLGLGARALDLLHTELGRHVAPGPYIATLSAVQTLVDVADDTFKRDWLPALAAGEVTAAIPAILSGPAALMLSAGRVAGRLHCLGAKNARLLLAPVDTGDWVVVELAAAHVMKIPAWDLTRTLIQVDLNDSAPILTLADGAAVAAALVRYTALMIASDSRGAARSIAEQTVAYMKAREQFGRPIASFQALKHRVANVVARLAVIDQIVAHAVDSLSFGEGARLWPLLAKSEASEAFADIATDCLQLHGGVGFTWDFDPQMFLKRAKLNEHLLMTNVALRDCAASELAAATRKGQSLLELSFT